MVDVTLVLAGVHEHLGDDPPPPAGLLLQDVHGAVIAQGDGAAADEALAGDLKVGGDDDDLVGHHAQHAARRGGESAVAEVLVGEQATEVADDRGTPVLDAAERAFTQSASAV